MSFSGRYPEHDICENFNSIDVRELQLKTRLRPGLWSPNHRKANYDLDQFTGAPADNSSAEDVDDDVEVEIRPFRRPHQFRDGDTLFTNTRAAYEALPDVMKRRLAGFPSLLLAQARCEQPEVQTDETAN
jgi:hypothetical protein